MFGRINIFMRSGNEPDDVPYSADFESYWMISKPLFVVSLVAATVVALAPRNRPETGGDCRVSSSVPSTRRLGLGARNPPDSGEL